VTIDKLLEIAQEYVGYATDAQAAQERLIEYAAIAQAAAATAQAMMLAQMTSTGTDINNTFSRWLRVDTGN